MRYIFASFSAVAFAAGPTSTLLWVQNENAAVYTSAGLARHVGSTPTFATATWLNKPFYVETFNCTDNGTSIWEFDFPGDPPQGAIPTYMVDMARHAVSFGPSAEVVDTVAAGAFFVPPSPCNVYGWSSTGTGVPRWNWTLPNCDASLLYDEYRNIAISDDGTTAVFSAFVPQGQSGIPLLVAFNAQTGKELFRKGTADAGAQAGTVGTSVNGSFITWSTANGIVVYDGKGAKRTTLAAEGPNEISDSGDFLATCTENNARVWGFDGSNGNYAQKFSFSPPASPASDTWFCVDVAMSSDGTGAEDTELVSFAWISGDVLTARVITYSMVSGKVMIDWVSSTNAKLQTNPTVRMDGNFVGTALWGDSDDVPTAVVLKTGSNTPVFTYTTPGSMFGVEIVVDHAACTPTNDVLYFAVAGKHTPANVMGNGGDAFAWRINVPK